jgi:hypothetical protein
MLNVGGMNKEEAADILGEILEGYVERVDEEKRFQVWEWDKGRGIMQGLGEAGEKKRVVDC